MGMILTRGGGARPRGRVLARKANHGEHGGKESAQRETARIQSKKGLTVMLTAAAAVAAGMAASAGMAAAKEAVAAAAGHLGHLRRFEGWLFELGFLIGGLF